MVSIIIINFKNPALLRLCLKSLDRIADPRIATEIIVVDIASTPETRNVVSHEFPKTTLIPFRDNVGYTHGANEGLKRSKGNYVLILNPDVIPTHDSIQMLADFMRKDGRIGLAGPQLLNFDGTPQSSCFRFYTPWTIIFRRTFLGDTPLGKKMLSFFLMKDKDLSKETSVDWLMGSAMMVSRQALGKVGLMDERLFLYMSDVDWARRFWENGYTVMYYPQSKMYHYHRRGSKGRSAFIDIFLKKESQWHVKDAFSYFMKWGWSRTR